MIDLELETPLSLPEAAKLKVLHVNGKRPAVSTLWRWVSNGCRGEKLETVRIGGTVCTSERAVMRFLARLNGQSVAADPSIIAERTRSIEAAERALDAAGVR